MTDSLRKAILTVLERNLNIRVDLLGSRPQGGGDINKALRLDTSAGCFFIKFNNAQRYPGMFKLEADGLNLMRKTQTVFVPEVIGYGDDGQDAFLLLEFLESGHRSNQAMEEAGRLLALMHRHSSPRFGLEHDNYIGSLPQKNTPYERWTDFFVACRIEPMLRKARDKGLADQKMQRGFEHLFSRLDELIPAEPPALVHGDLWGGNYLAASNSRVYLIDPAVYYGNREMDLAMTRLFGGFPDAFYEGYASEYPLQAGWVQRTEIHNLYPLLVHVNLFGGGYVSSVASIVGRFY
ncbi:MAG: fructosamine kinase family protein [Bacteroidales bacterium]